jgi:hypothetical protein
MATFLKNWISMFRSAKLLCATSAVRMHQTPSTTATGRVA